jgi:hypothetical protein
MKVAIKHIVSLRNLAASWRGHSRSSRSSGVRPSEGIAEKAKCSPPFCSFLSDKQSPHWLSQNLGYFLIYKASIDARLNKEERTRQTDFVNGASERAKQREKREECWEGAV